MNEEILQRLEKLEQWVESKKQNQLTYPLDEISKNLVLNQIGTGSFGTQTVSVTGGGGGTVSVPAQPSGTLKVIVNGTVRELLVK